jgi:hypothetical protein
MATEPDESSDHPLADVTPIRYSIFASTTAQIVARAYGINPLDVNRREDTLRAMDALIEAMDALERMKKAGWHGVGEDSYVQRRGRLVEYVRDGGCIADLCEDDELCRLRVQMSWNEVVTTLAKKTNAAKPSRLWLFDRWAWLQLEAVIDEGGRPSRALARELGIALSSLQNLFELYRSAGRYAKVSDN